MSMRAERWAERGGDAADHRPTWRWRSRAGSPARRPRMTAIADGVMSDHPSACTTRAAINVGGLGASVHAVAATVKIDSPVNSMRLRPKRLADHRGQDQRRTGHDRVRVEHPRQLRRRHVGERAAQVGKRHAHDRLVQRRDEAAHRSEEQHHPCMTSDRRWRGVTHRAAAGYGHCSHGAFSPNTTRRNVRGSSRALGAARVARPGCPTRRGRPLANDVRRC